MDSFGSSDGRDATVTSAICNVSQRESSTKLQKCCAFFVFLIDNIVVVCLAILAFFLRYTQIFSVFRRNFRCDDTSISFHRNQYQNTNIVFRDYTEFAFFFIVLIVPSILILVCQIDATLCSSIDSIWKKVRFLVTKTIKISAGFWFGVIVSSIISDATKLTTGRLRPYFLEVCTNACLNDSSSFILSNETIDDLSLCLESTENGTDIPRISLKAIRESRMSFPSSDVTISTFVGLFIILYLNKRLQHECFRMVKSCTSFLVLLAIILLANSKLITNRNFVDDIIFSVILGVAIGLYICYIHLQSFEYENTVRLPSKSVLNSIQIPRVIYRGNRRSKPEQRILQPEVRFAGDGIINPAFHRDADDTRLTARPPSTTRFVN